MIGPPKVGGASHIASSVFFEITASKIMQTNNYNKYYLFQIVLVAALGGLLFGYDWVVIGGAKPFYEPYFGLLGEQNAWRSSWAMSCALVGCLVGAISSGFLSDRYGRKKMLILSAIFFVVSSLWIAASRSFDEFIVARILGGVGIGLASAISPLYIAEITPSAIRGRMVAINQFAIVVGVLAAQLANLYIYNIEPIPHNASTEVILASWNGTYGWRWMFAAGALPAVVFLLMAFSNPESPRWLIGQNRSAEAEVILKKIGGDDYANQESRSVSESMHLEGVLDTSAITSQWHQLKEKKTSKIVWLGIFLAVFQQWSGINIIFNYADEIFTAAGFELSGLMMNIVLTGVVNLVFTIVAMKTVDRWGRRPLMLLGSFLLALLYLLLGLCYYLHVQGIFMVAVILMAIATYATTLAPITWVLLSELFPNRVRGLAMSLAVSALWIGSFLLVYTFKSINVALGATGTFWLYGIICFFSGIAIWKFVPETKGRSLEQIEADLTQK